MGSPDAARDSTHPTPPEPTPAQVRRWRRHLADELAEAAIYRQLAHRTPGPHGEILHRVALAEGRHAQHWKRLLGPHAGKPATPSVRSAQRYATSLAIIATLGPFFYGFEGMVLNGAISAVGTEFELGAFAPDAAGDQARLLHHDRRAALSGDLDALAVVLLGAGK